MGISEGVTEGAEEKGGIRMTLDDFGNRFTITQTARTKINNPMIKRMPFMKLRISWSATYALFAFRCTLY